MRFLLAFALILLLPATSRADVSPSALCRSAISMAEKSLGIPDRLMQAIGVVESGRTDERGGVTAWPWTINVEGTGYVFDNKQDAIAAVNKYRAQGARSIDVGCMQVNLLAHADAFATLDQAFDPMVNARYSAEFLQRLMAETGSWPRAAAAYHSMTPDIGADYARKVLTVWARPGLGEPVPYTAVRHGMAMANLAPPLSAFGPVKPNAAGTTASPMASLASARAIPTAVGSPVAAAGVGRGLAAYRAAPTRLATSFVQRPG